MRPANWRAFLAISIKPQEPSNAGGLPKVVPEFRGAW